MAEQQARPAWLQRIYDWFPAWIWAWLVFVVPVLAMCFWRIYQLRTDPGNVIAPSDPDPWVRLTLVRDLLVSGDWYNHILAHSNAPDGGISSAWTRPLDVIIAGLTLLHPGSAPVNMKLLDVASLLPALWIGLILLGLFRILRRICDIPFAYFFGAGLFFALVGARNYIGAGNADHHAPLTALWIWVLSYMLTPTPARRDTSIIGILLGVMLWINPEGLLLIAATYIIYGMRWLCSKPTHAAATLDALMNLTSATALTALAAVMVEYRPAAWFTPVYDSISIVYAYLLLLCAVTLRLLALFAMPTIRAKLLGTLCSAIIIFVAMYAAYPMFFGGPFVAMDPYIRDVFLPSIAEAQPIWKKPFYLKLAVIICPLIALSVLILNLRRQQTFLRHEHAWILLFLLCFTSGLFFSHFRFYYYCWPVLLPTLTIFFTNIFIPDHPRQAPYWPSRVMNQFSVQRQVYLRMGTMLLMIGLPNLFGQLYSMEDNQTPAAEANETNLQSTSPEACEDNMLRWIHSGALTRALGDESVILFAPTNVGGEILFFTPYRIIASNYHRDGRAIEYIWDADKINNEADLRAHFAKRHVEAFLLCPNKDAPTNSYLNLLYATKVKANWLSSIAVADKNVTKDIPQLWRVHEFVQKD